MNFTEACAMRLHRHHLLTQSAADAAEVAGALCGVHAQIASAAEVSVALRTPSSDRDCLVKTFGIRGTVHLFPERELGFWMGALATVPKQRNDFVPTEEGREAIVAAIGEAIDGACLTVEELDREVVARVGPWAGELVMPAFQGHWPRWRSVLHEAAYSGMLVFGPMRERRVTYTRPTVKVAGDAGELLVRYLRSYGPATPQQFARWVSAPIGWAHSVFTSVGDRLAQTPLGLVLAEDRDMQWSAPPTLRLLPYFDAYTVGCHPRDLVFPGRAIERALSRGQAGNVPVMLVDGVVAGVWHSRKSGRRTAITVEPFGKLKAAQRKQLDEQVQRIAEATGTTPTLTIGEVTAGRHL